MTYVKRQKTATSTLKPSMGGIVNTERAFQRFYIDFIGPFPRTRKGNIGIFIILDHLTKFTFLKLLRKLTTKPVIDYLINEIFPCFGVPEIIVSDNGSQFKSREFERMTNKYGIKHQFTAVHSPQSNASECVNRSINEALRSFVRNDQEKWDEYLPSINCAIRSSVRLVVRHPTIWFSDRQ